MAMTQEEQEAHLRAARVVLAGVVSARVVPHMERCRHEGADEVAVWVFDWGGPRASERQIGVVASGDGLVWRASRMESGLPVSNRTGLTLAEAVHHVAED